MIWSSLVSDMLCCFYVQGARIELGRLEEVLLLHGRCKKDSLVSSAFVRLNYVALSRQGILL